MKIKNIRAMNFEGAFRGMRNPMNSWDKSDSYFGIVIDDWYDALNKITINWMLYLHPEFKKLKEIDIDHTSQEYKGIEDWLMTNGTLKCGTGACCDLFEAAYLGPNDLHLAQKLIKAGPEHRKFMRQIFVSMDIEGPVYWWKELDTYAVGTSKNSTSSMHTLVSNPITLDCFETKDFSNDTLKDFNLLVSYLEKLRIKYNETKDKTYWKELICLLPQCFLQTRTMTMNYENLLNICKQRKGHKLTEWAYFIDCVRENLPYANELIFLIDED